MTFAFWCIATLMVVIAISGLFIPLGRKRSSSRPVRLVLAASIPSIAIGVYTLVGAPDALTAARDSSPSANRDSATRSNVTSERTVASVSSLLDGLKLRLQENPDDAGGWLLLAQSYQHLGRQADAQAAYQHARALGKTDPRFETTSVPSETISGNKDLDDGPALRGRVTLADELSDQVKPNDTIFIFAKESREHRMPLVAMRRPAADLPIDFKLTNTEAMIAGTDLANYDSLIVNARVSRSGMATHTEVGLDAWSAMVSPTGDHFIELVITPGHASPGLENE